MVGNGGNRGDGGYGCYWRSCLHHVMCRGEGESSGVCLRERERREGEERRVRKEEGI